MGIGEGIAAAARDPLNAVGLLTRVPVPVDAAQAAARGGRGAWAWPLAGLVPGGAAAAILAAGGAGDVTPGVAAALALGAACALTGALHEDGLADTADGFWGGADAARRLEIMRDSRIGTYGACALIVAFLLRWSALAALAAAGAWAAPLVAAIASRAGMAALAGLLPHARPGGLSASVGRPGRNAMLGAAVIGIAACGLAPGGALAAAIIVAVLILGLAALSRARIGGQTGDVLGAAQVTGECAVLVVLAAAA